MGEVRPAMRIACRVCRELPAESCLQDFRELPESCLQGLQDFRELPAELPVELPAGCRELPGELPAGFQRVACRVACRVQRIACRVACREFPAGSAESCL